MDKLTLTVGAEQAIGSLMVADFHPFQMKVKRVHPNAVLPQYQTAGAACFDLHAVIDGPPVFVAPGQAYDFRIGLAFEVPPGWVMLVYSRSGHGFKSSVRLSNCTGVIDSDFRGEMHVKLIQDPSSGDHDALLVKHGDRVGQCMLVPAPQWRLVEVDELSETVRGEGGYGSTGA